MFFGYKVKFLVKFYLYMQILRSIRLRGGLHAQNLRLVKVLFCLESFRDHQREHRDVQAEAGRGQLLTAATLRLAFKNFPIENFGPSIGENLKKFRSSETAPKALQKHLRSAAPWPPFFLQRVAERRACGAFADNI